MAKAEAETLAVAALGFIAGDEDALSRFLALAGIGPESLRRAAAEPGFLGGVLDYLLSHEPLLLAFAAHERISPDAVAAARRGLDG